MSFDRVAQFIEHPKRRTLLKKFVEDHGIKYRHIRTVFETRWLNSARDQLQNLISILPYVLMWLDELPVQNPELSREGTKLRHEISSPKILFALHTSLDIIHGCVEMLNLPFQSSSITPVQVSQSVDEFKTFLNSMNDRENPSKWMIISIICFLVFRRSLGTKIRFKITYKNGKIIQF